ncbi:WD40 repeat domain-containing protein [Paraneptunicella aestuarii]|uniref:WD40 repeat domain-containing protein n=1 Tax=Paraneptunicella aestuarii TaxID=2831148 RepID=UPI001E5CF6E8|nr:WD40 repeat domain-containing protein [Paraneptunicella aestuarii]UAA37136.1 WD40 repeat domain-containing protein [Paraneptunicella aestuarii]
MMKHNSPISGIASLGDQYVATAGYDNKVILWDAKTKHALAQGVHDHLANQCVFRPDGKYLASTSSDYSVRIWQLPSMRLTHLLNEHTDDVEFVCFNPVNDSIATCSRDKSIRIYDGSGKQQRVLLGHEADVLTVQWMADGEQLVSTSDDGTIRTWNANTGEMLAMYDFEGVETDTIVVSSDGAIFAGNDEGEISLLQGGELQQTFQAHDAGIKRLVYSETSKRLVSLSYDRTVKIWQLDDKQQLNLKLDSKLPPVIWPRSCAFVGEEQLAFATFGSCYALLNLNNSEWDLSGIDPTGGKNAVYKLGDDIYSIGDAGIFWKNDEPVTTLPSLCNFITSVNGVFVTGGQTGEVFNALTGDVIYQHRSPLNCGATHKTDAGAFVYVGTYTGEVLVFDVSNDGKIQFSKEIQVHDNAIKDVATSATELFSVSASAGAAYNQLSDLQRSHLIEEGHSKIANGCSFVGNDQFASISRDLKLRVWRNHEAIVFDTPHQNSIKCIAYNPSSNMVATCDYTGHAGLFDMNTEQYVAFTRLTNCGLSCVTADDQGTGFKCSSYDGHIYDLNV